MKEDNHLQLSQEALAALERESELGEVVDDVGYERGEGDRGNVIVQPAMESGFSSADVYSVLVREVSLLVLVK